MENLLNYFGFKKYSTFNTGIKIKSYLLRAFIIFFSLFDFSNANAQTSPTTITASINLVPGYNHPGSTNYLAACYDHFELNLTGFTLPANCTLSVTIPTGVNNFTNLTVPGNLDWQFTTSGGVTTEMHLENSTGMDIYVNTAGFRFEYNGCSNSNNLTVDLEFPISLCGTAFNLIANPLQPYISVPIPSPNPPKQSLVLAINRQVNKLLSIEDAKIYYNQNGTFSFIPSSYSSNINKYALYNEIIDRYYIVYPESGISDYFTLDMKTESDAEVISIEAIRSGVNFTLYNDPSPIPSGANYKIVFSGVNASTSTLPTNFAPYPYSSANEVKAHISDCVYSGTDDCIYNDNTSTGLNFIIIHEQLRITKVENCGIVLGNLASSYTLSSECDENYNQLNNQECSASTLALDLICRQNSVGVSIKPKYLDGATYHDLTNNLFAICSASGTTTSAPFSETDLIIDIKNTSTNALTNGAGTIEIENVGFRINTNYFTYTDIKIGSIIVPNSAITLSTSSNSEFSDIQIDFKDPTFIAAFMANPNIGPDGLTKQLHANLPITNGPYVFLPEGAEFGIRLTGFKFKDCYLLSECDHEWLSMTNTFNIDYKSMCDLWQGTITSVTPQVGTFDYTNMFQGYTTSKADPLDIAPPATTKTNLTFSFIETAASGSLNPIPKEPFAIEQPHTAGNTNILSCPNIEYYARVKLPLIYTPQSADVTNSLDGSLIASSVIPILVSPGIYEYHWQGNTPNYSINFDAVIACNGTVGMDEFVCEMRENCDNNCTDCAITYSCKSVYVNRHCPGSCPPLLVTSKNFKLERTTLGWASENDFESNPNSPTTIVEKDKVYPCDQVNVISTLGTTGINDIQTNTSTGIPDLLKLYYEVSYPITEFNGSLVNIFDFDATMPSYFSITPNNYAAGCSNNSINVPINSSNVDFTIRTNSLGQTFHVVKFHVDLNSPTTYTMCGATTSKTLFEIFRDYSTTIEINSYLKIKDMVVTEGYYDLNRFIGIFAYDYSDVTTHSTEYAPSCDPYLARLTYFQIKSEIATNQLLGPSSTSMTLSQCQLGYWMQVKVKGGYPSGADFPNEYRPVIVFPDHIGFNSTNGIQFTSGYFFDDHISGCATNYPMQYSGGNNYNFTSVLPCNFHPGIAKSQKNQREIIMFFDKNCVNTATVVDEVIDFTDFNLQKYPGTSCATNLMDAANSHITYHKSADELTNVNFVVSQVSQNQNFNANSSPYSIPFGIKYNLSPSPLLENGWVYFTGPTGSSFALFDAQHIALPSHNIIVGANTISVFHLGDLTTNHLNNYQVEMAWTNCSPDPSGNGFAAIPFEMHYGAACAGYASLTAANYPFDACYGNFMIPFTITPQQSHLALNGNNAIVVSGCSPVLCEFSLNNTGADLTNTTLTLTPPNNFAIDFSNSHVDYISGGVSHTIQLTGPLPLDINTLLSTLHYNADNFPQLDFVITLVPSNWYPTTTENIDISVSGTSQCGIAIAANITLNCSFVNIPQLTITGGNICDGQSAILFADLNPVSSPSYLWSTGNTSSIYSTNTPGTYTVTVEDNGCIYEGSTNVIAASSPVPDLPATVTTCQSSQISITACSTCSNCNYLWSTGATSNSITTASLISNYTVTVTDIVTGCSATVSTIKNNEFFPINILIDPSSPAYICRNLGSPAYPILTTNDLSTGNYPNYAPFTYIWTDPLANISNFQSISATTSGQYSLTITSANGCTATNTYFVDDITPVVSFQTPVITSPNPGTPYVEALNVSPPPASYTSYAWSTGATTPTITVAPIVSTTYSVTVTNTLGGVVCSGTASGIINTGPGSDDCYVYNNAINVSSFVNGGNIGNIGSGIPIIGFDLNSDLVVNSGTLTLSNCNIAIKAFAKIILNNNASLVIGDNVHLYSCGTNMWEGITANPGTTVFMNTAKLILIEDAVNALYAKGNGPNGQTPTITCTGNVVFNNNFIAIKLINGDFSNANFNGSRFTCSSTLKFPYGSGANLYSYHHILAENAGTLNLYGLNGNNYSNLFSDATVAIKCRNTNLNVDNCSFEIVNNINVASFGIYAMTYASHARTTVNIGALYGTNPLFKKNRFSRLKQGVAVFANNDLAVFDNDFIDLNIGVRVENMYHGFVQILRNSFVRNSARSIDVMDCLGSRIDILNNKINYLQPFNLLQESAKGIYVRNSSLSGATTLKIRDNILENCFFGIQVMNQAGGDIQGNIIYFHVSDADLLTPLAKNFRKGICLQNSSYIYVTNSNQVERNNCGGCTNDANIAGKMTGIYEGMGKVNLIKDNILTDLPTGITVYGNCPGTQFECNAIVNGSNLSVEGFRLNNAVLDNQGYDLHPNGNKWVIWNPTKQHIFSTNPNQTPFEWYYDNAINSLGVSETEPLNRPQAIQKVPTTGYADCIASTGPCNPCDEARLAAVLTATNDSNTAIEDAYVYRQYVYSRLNDSLQLMYSGSVHDVDLQTFFTIYSLSASGQLGDVNDLLQNNDRATAFIMNEVVNPDQLVEYNNQVVNRVSVMEYEDSIRLSPTQVAELIPIAYQLPQLGGEAVYRARAILGLDFDDYLVANRNSTAVNIQSQFLIFPNPGNGQFTISSNSLNLENTEIEICDNLGRVVYYKLNTEQSRSININIHTQSIGIYSLHLKQGSTNLFNTKIVKTK